MKEPRIDSPVMKLLFASPGGRPADALARDAGTTVASVQIEMAEAARLGWVERAPGDRFVPTVAAQVAAQAARERLVVTPADVGSVESLLGKD